MIFRAERSTQTQTGVPILAPHVNITLIRDGGEVPQPCHYVYNFEVRIEVVTLEERRGQK